MTVDNQINMSNPGGYNNSDDKSYTVRDLIKTLMDAPDHDVTITFSLRNSDAIIVTDVDFEEEQVVLKGDV